MTDAVAHVVIQAPLPYQLRCTVRVTDAVTDERLVTVVDGDLYGPARLELSPTADGCDARLVWELDLRAPLLRSMAVVARPAMAWAHDRIVERGLVQFEGHALRARPSTGWCSPRPRARARGASRVCMRLATLPTLFTCFTRRSRACSAAAFRFCSCSTRQCLNTTGTRIWSWCAAKSYTPASAITRACALKSAMPAPGISKLRTCRSIAATMPDGSISRAADARSR